MMDGEITGSGAKPARHGVPFDAWAFVLAGLGDGLPLEELLAHLGVDDERWTQANAAFNEALLDDVEAGGTLSEALDEAMRDARKRWTRAIPPLDVELRAWLDFHRAWAASAAPLEYLRARGLQATDIHRLQAHWATRLAEDRALRDEALAILEAPAGPAPEPHPEPARLIPAVSDEASGTDRTPAHVGCPSREPLPFAEGEAAPAHPRLSVPLPPSQAATRHGTAEQTRVAVRLPGPEVVLPFPPPGKMGEPAGGNHDSDPPGVAGAHVWAEGEGPEEFTVERYATLCVDSTELGIGESVLLRRYGITAAQKATLDTYWTQRMAEDTAIWLAWDRACAEYRRAGVRE
jgi:hypothetical protein